MNSIPYGSEHLTLPDILHTDKCDTDFLTLAPTALEEIKENDKGHELIMSALMSPVNRPPLLGWIKKYEKTAILIPDITRKCPVKLILESFLKEIPTDDISIIIATGNHRELTHDEIASITGAEIAASYNIINHNSNGVCSYVGTTSKGNHVMINKHIVEADKVIMIGTANYHSFAGFSGGRKSVLPGAAARETIMYNHKLCVTGTELSDVCGPGTLSGNPIHEDMEEALTLLGLEKLFIINTVINIHGQVLGAYAGCPIKAFEKAVEHVRELYSVEISRKYDIIVTSSGGAPADLNFYQSQKALEMSYQFINEGGDYFLVCECRDGLGEDKALYVKWLSLDGAGLIQMFKNEFHNLGFGPYKIMRLYEAGCPMYLVSGNVSELDDVLHMKRISPESFSDKITERINLYNKQGIIPKIAVIPYGSFTCLDYK